MSQWIIVSGLMVAACAISAFAAEAAPGAEDGGWLAPFAARHAALERGWRAMPQAGYFTHGLELLREVAAHRRADAQQIQLIHDLAAGLFGKPTRALASGDDTRVAWSCQAEAAGLLCDEAFIGYRTSLPGWGGERMRRVRLLMLVESQWRLWIHNNWDGKPPALDSTVGAPDPGLGERNGYAAMQHDVRQHLQALAPDVDGFVLKAFTAAPADLREIDELLALGHGDYAQRLMTIKAIAEATQAQIPAYLELPPQK
jgi:hypothetical protein